MAAHRHHHLPDLFRFFLVFIAALAIGFGVPSFWLWIGSMYQGAAGETRLTTEGAVIVFAGVILSYLLLMIAGATLSARQRTGLRQPDHWNRSMRDEPRRRAPLTPTEAAFVAGAILATVAHLIWLFTFAGSPLPVG